MKHDHTPPHPGHRGRGYGEGGLFLRHPGHRRGGGNGPAYIHHTANVAQAVKRILDSKTFDNGTICASEQSIVTTRAMEGAVSEELKGAGGLSSQR